MLPLCSTDPAVSDSLKPPDQLVQFLQACRTPATLGLLALDGGCLQPSSKAIVARAAWAASNQDGSFAYGAVLGAVTNRQPMPNALPFGTTQLQLMPLALMSISSLTTRQSSAGFAGASLAMLQAMFPGSGTRWRPGSSACCLPSHGKSPGYEPDHGYPDAATCRPRQRLCRRSCHCCSEFQVAISP